MVIMAITYNYIRYLFETPYVNIPVQCTNNSSRSRIQRLYEPAKRSVLDQDIEVFSCRLNQFVGQGVHYCDALGGYPAAFFGLGVAMEEDFVALAVLMKQWIMVGGVVEVMGRSKEKLTAWVEEYLEREVDWPAMCRDGWVWHRRCGSSNFRDEELLFLVLEECPQSSVSFEWTLLRPM